MFSNLIESGSHTKDFKRKGSFFLGTLVFYGALLMAAGVGSIYAYNVRLDEQNTDIVVMMRFPPMRAQAEPVTREAPRRAASASTAARPTLTQRPEISVQTPYRNDRIASANVREVHAREVVHLSNMTTDAEPSGPIGPRNLGGDPRGSTTGTGDAPRVNMDETEPPPTPRVKTETKPPAEVKKPTVVSLGVINGRALDKPVPVYSAIAKAARAQGVVTVQILVDEAGKVISAQATNGHPLLRKEAVAAAYRARFSPTLLSNQPVKVSGIITYNFQLQ